MLRIVIPVLLILLIMYLLMFLNNRKRRQRALEDKPHYRDTYIKRQSNIAQPQNDGNRRQNYVTKYQATVDYMEKETHINDISQELQIPNGEPEQESNQLRNEEPEQNNR